MGEFKESEHPRDKDGKFTKKGNNSKLKKLGAALKEMLSEKQRKQMTPITDRAISSIKHYEIYGYSSSECEYITNQHKELLKFAKENNQNKEVAFVFSRDFSAKDIISGDETNVVFSPQSMDKGTGIFVMHNHPRNSSFSIEDLSLMFSVPRIQTMSIVKNNGGVEILTRTKQIDNAYAFSIYLRYKEEYKNNIISPEKASQMILKKLIKKGYIKWIK